MAELIVGDVSSVARDACGPDSDIDILVEFAHTTYQHFKGLKAYLEELGIPCELSWNDEKTKANLFATIGDESKPGIVLSGHTDVVPVTGQNWPTDPFKAEIINDRLYGRGSCDMKGYIAVCLAKAKSIIDAD